MFKPNSPQDAQNACTETGLGLFRVLRSCRYSKQSKALVRGVKIIAGFGLQIETSSALAAPGDPR